MAGPAVGGVARGRARRRPIREPRAAGAGSTYVRKLFTLLLPLLATFGCTRREPVAPVDTVSSGSSVATLELADSLVATNQTIVVTAAFVPSVSVAQIGAFTVRMTYDTTRLTFLPQSSTVPGTGAINATDGVLSVAAISLTGFTSSQIFRAAFQTLEAGPTPHTGALRLTVDEMVGTDFSNRLPTDASRLTVTAR
jgi:TctA family transporter